MNVATATAAGTAKDSSSATMAQGPSPTSTAASLTQPPEDLEEEVLEAEDEAVEDDDELELLGTISTDTGKNCQIVGIRYYTGKAHPGEYVHLAREPSNPYDRNAIRVDNMHGQKVGHLKKEMAFRLAPLMDRFLVGDDALLTIDASIPRPGNHYCLPIVMDFRVKNRLRNAADNSLHQQMDEFFANVLHPSHRNEQQRQLAASQNSAATTAAGMPRPPTVHVQAKKLDWKTQQKQLDDFFNEQSKHQLENLPDMEVPQQLTQTLFDHQIQGVKWLVQRERGLEPSPFYQPQVEGNKSVWFCNITNASQPNPPKIVRGAILADDMGLGKTIQAIALILANPPEGKVYQAPVAAAAAAAADAVAADDKPSAVDIPQKKPSKSAVKALKVTALKNVLMAAGLAIPAKKADMAAVVLAGLEAETISLQLYYTSIEKPPPAAPVVAAAGTGPQPQCTLIVCPVSVMGNWQAQIEEHVQSGTLKVGLYHGTDRKEMLDGVEKLDVLITSYNTLGYDYGKDGKAATGPNGEPATKVFKGVTVFNTKFHRIILDEAHKIGSGKSRIFKACNALLGERRICLSGTPIQNRPDELQALFEFMGDPTLGDRTVFRRAVSQPIKEGDDQGLSRLRSMMKHIALRRNKSTANIELAEKSVELRSVEFAPGNPHYDIYQTIYKSAKLAVQATMQGKAKESDKALLSHGSVFEILTRMRQACCSGKLVPQDRLERAEQVLAAIENKESLTAEEGKELLDKLKGVLQAEDDSPPECAICFDVMTEDAATVLRVCGHVFCASCLGKVSQGAHSKCPLCRHDFQQNDMVKWSSAVAAASSEAAPVVALSQHMDEMCPSPKLEALLLGLREMKDGEKGVIFSQFTKFLDEIQKFLDEHNYTYTRIDGSRTATQRVGAMKEFGREDGGPTFMLCSLHAAGTGLNLTRGNHIFMMDTWFNLAVEQQAMDRVHRIGQKRPVRVVRFVAADSVESRMVALQEAKAAQAKGCFEHLSAEEKKKARLEDVKKLLEID